MPLYIEKVIQPLSLNSDPCDWILSSRANECLELRHFFMPQERIKIFEKCITRSIRSFLFTQNRLRMLRFVTTLLKVISVKTT